MGARRMVRRATPRLQALHLTIAPSYAISGFDEIRIWNDTQKKLVHRYPERDRQARQSLHGQVLPGFLDAEHRTDVDASTARAFRLPDAQPLANQANALAHVRVQSLPGNVRNGPIGPLIPVIV